MPGERPARFRPGADRDPRAGRSPAQEVVDRFKTAYPDARVIGDAVRGGRIVDATQDAYGQAFVFEP